jgi:hypothetical protein
MEIRLVDQISVKARRKRVQVLDVYQRAPFSKLESPYNSSTGENVTFFCAASEMSNHLSTNNDHCLTILTIARWFRSIPWLTGEERPAGSFERKYPNFHFPMSQIL